MEETERLFECTFCRVKSYLVAPDCFRYLLPCDPPADDDLIYFPYWRFKGTLLTSLPSGVRSKFIDVSRQAVQATQIPVSVGFRSQALKLRFVTPESRGRFVRPTVSLDDMVTLFKTQFGGTLPKPILCQSHVGESVSLLYAPFYMRDRLFDAVLKTPVRHASGGPIDLDRHPFDDATGSMLFLPTLCPHCGWDLEGAADTLVLICKNCSSAWYPAGSRLKALKFGILEEPGEDIFYLPFWRISADISDIQLHSYADLVRIANLPLVARAEWQNVPFRFWVPAFKIRPKMFLRLAEVMTLGLPVSGITADLPRQPHHAVTLPVTEALESLKILLAGFFRPRRRLAELIPDIDVAPRGFSLIYMPFRDAHHEFIQPHREFAVNKNVLALSRNL